MFQNCFHAPLRLLKITSLLIFVTPVRLLRWKGDTSRSSIVSIIENRILKGCVIHRQRSYDFLSCAHLCLGRSDCVSVNYENVRNGICELNGLSSLLDTNAVFTTKWGYLFSHKIIPYHKYIFTTLGARGRTGPTSTAGYEGTSLEGQVILDKGIQIWTVPVTGTYVIEAYGASGANGTDVDFLWLWKLGGLGAKIAGTFQLVQGTQLKVLVGQEGGTNDDFGGRPGGGGGGSFVTLMDDSPLIIAGGGGGGGTARDNFTDGDPGQATRNGSQCGGTQGGGGQVCNAQTGKRDPSLKAAGGAGVLGNGNSTVAIGEAPLSFRNGGTGGKCPAADGGFGGGSFAFVLGGGGGGYSGGGVFGTANKGTAGGGGSYNDGNPSENYTFFFGYALQRKDVVDIVPERKYSFTTLGVRGATGPTSTAGYKGTSLKGQVILDKGIQIWTVPVNGTYVIEASGASGGNGTYAFSPLLWKLGGLGAKITGTFQLVQGTQLKVLVGQEGGTNNFFLDRPGGGGGGSFVTLMDDSPLIIAGGGGGGGAARENFTDGDPGQATRNGSQCGGTQGGGGHVCNAQTGKRDPSLSAGGGAGLLGNGTSGTGLGVAPLSFGNGGRGGKGPSANGGFGGGSFAFVLGGGGGGYSGGGVFGTADKGTAGGGGSYNVKKRFVPDVRV